MYLDGGTATVRYNTINGGSGSNESNGIYVNGADSKMIVQHNDINGGSSISASSNGIYIETAGEQIITDNDIDGGTGSIASQGIYIRDPLSSSSLIARNTINGGSSSLTYGIHLENYTNDSTLNCEISGNRIDGGAGASTYGIYAGGIFIGMAVAPLICNNVIEAVGTSQGCGIYVTYTSATVPVYNNTIIWGGTTNYSSGIFAIGDGIRPTNIDVQNNIFIGQSSGGGNDIILYNPPYEPGVFSPVKNNVFWGLFIDSNYSSDQIATFNALSDEIDGNIVVDPIDLALDAYYNFTASSPTSVTEGGLDLSGIAAFPENGAGQKIDYAGTARTSAWSIGAYERD